MKHEVWRAFCDLLSICPTQYHKHSAVACLLSHLLDDEEIADARILDSIKRTRTSLDVTRKKPCRSVNLRGKLEQI